ncbi:MAG: hypothetical protein ACHQ4J_06485 [Candidatus Binatia bacterium]
MGAILAANVRSAEDHAVLAGALGISAFLASLEKFITQAPLLVRWIRTGVGDGLSAFASFMFLLVVTLVAAFLSGQGESKVVTASEPPIATSNSVLFVNVAANDGLSKVDHESVFLIPFLDEAGGCSTSDAGFEKGWKLDETTTTFIGQLANGLLHCARADRPVKLEVRGFASSKQFDEKCGPHGRPLSVAESQRLNKEIANARARAVVDEFAVAEAKARIADQSLVGRVFVEPIVWADFDAMKADQRWNDESAGKYSHERAILTRRAELRVIDSGDCEAVTSSRPNPFTGGTADQPSSSRSEG